MPPDVQTWWQSCVLCESPLLLAYYFYYLYRVYCCLLLVYCCYLSNIPNKDNKPCSQTCKPGDKVMQESSSQDKTVSIRNPAGQESIVSQVKKFTIWRKNNERRTMTIQPGTISAVNSEGSLFSQSAFSVLLQNGPTVESSRPPKRTMVSSLPCRGFEVVQAAWW